jgi:YHS domain-containing protein
MRHLFTSSKCATLILSLGLAASAFAGKADPVYSDSGLAIRGYDPVAYYQDSRPVKGASQFAYRWMGATWLFASAENRDRFQAEPLRYAPQYGGYCAYGVSQGHTVSIDPEAWRIVDSKLYLNYSKDVQKKWVEDVPGNIQKADRNWPGLHK